MPNPSNRPVGPPALAEYAHPRVPRSVLELMTSVVPYLALSVLMYLALDVLLSARAGPLGSRCRIPRAHVRHVSRLRTWVFLALQTRQPRRRTDSRTVRPGAVSALAP